MNWYTGIMAFVVIWWLVLFAVLPWGNRPPDNPEPGHATSAPETPRLVIKFAVTTGIAVMVFGLLWGVIQSGWISFRT